MVARGAKDLDAAVRVVRDDAATANLGGEAHGLALDVGDKEAIHRIGGAAAALVSPIEIVVHAASSLGAAPMPLLMDTDCEELQRVLEVNLVGPFRRTKMHADAMPDADPATLARPADVAVQLLRLIAQAATLANGARLVAPGDLVVVNDAATLPATLPARDAHGAFVELRLVGALDAPAGSVAFRAALLGAGDHRTRTEDRPAPPPVTVGDILLVGDELTARVLAVASFSDRLVDVTLGMPGPADPAAVWAALYRLGKPVQYAYVSRPLALWDVQNVWAGRPWAVEMPFAGRALRIGTLLALRRRRVEIATVTHAAGLSATGDPAIDARLPFPERFEVPEATARAILRTRARGGRGGHQRDARARVGGGALGRGAAAGTTDLLLGPGTRLVVVDALLTGVHESDTTHFQLLGAFADRAVLEAALTTAEQEGFLGHELGDTWLVWRDRLRGASSATFAA